MAACLSSAFDALDNTFVKVFADLLLMVLHTLPNRVFVLVSNVVLLYN